MSAADPLVPDRRAALLDAARRVIAEDGVEAGIVLHPELASELAAAFADDVAAAIRVRTRHVRTLDELVEALVDGVLEGAETWRAALPLANLSIERLALFEQFVGAVGPWIDATADAIRAGQAAGLVREDVDAAVTAYLLRDALDRTAKACVLFRRPGHREAAAALVRGALRA